LNNTYEAQRKGTDRHYTGQIEELELGLYFYNRSGYDPALGRFVQPDSLIL
jgi:RHS repeat-associated protein